MCMRMCMHTTHMTCKHACTHAHAHTHTHTHLSNKCSKLIFFIRLTKQVETMEYNRLVNREQQIGDINLWQVIAVVGVT